jgi:hypothetical protein
VSARVQIVLGSPWNDAVIRYLEPRSPYRSWQHADDVRENDSIVVVFDTEPALVLTEVGRVGADLSIDNAIAGLNRELTNAVPAAQLGVELPAAPAVVDGAYAEALSLLLWGSAAAPNARIGSERPRPRRREPCSSPVVTACRSRSGRAHGAGTSGSAQ